MESHSLLINIIRDNLFLFFSLDSLCFMKHLQSKISLKCQAFSTWTAEVVGSTNQIALVTCDYESMLKPLLLGVQHVMEKEKVMKGKCEEDEDGLPVYKLLCDFSSSNLKEINTNEVSVVTHNTCTRSYVYPPF